MRSRAVLLIASLAASAVVLVACGSAGAPAATGGPPGRVVLAYTGTMSGEYARPGLDEAHAVQLAVAQANAAGMPLEFSAIDDGGENAARSLIRDPGVVAVVGPTFADQAQATAPLYSEAGLAAVSPSATGQNLTAQGFRAFFRDVAADDVQGRQAADYLVSVLRARTVYSIDDGSVYAAPRAAFEARLAGAGVRVERAGVPPTPDYRDVAARVVAARPDAVYYHGFYADLARLTGALRAAGYTGPIGSGDGSKDDRLVGLAGPAGNGVYLFCPCGAAGADPAGRAFTAAYRDMFHGEPGPYAAEAYDAANAVIDVLRTLGPGRADRAAVLAGVATVRHAGVTQQVAFRPGGEPVDAPITVYQVRPQGITPLGRVGALVR